jgi:signal recognition particle subunit SRP54
LFESLSDRLSGIFDTITGRGALSAADVDQALREVRRALLDADVALDVVNPSWIRCASAPSAPSWSAR